MNEYVIDGLVDLGEKVLSSEPPLYVLGSLCQWFAMLGIGIATQENSGKAVSLPAAVLWPCLLFMGSGIFESPFLKISCILLGALENQPRHFRTAICLSAAQEINQNPKALSLFPQASTLETPRALLQLSSRTAEMPRAVEHRSISLSEKREQKGTREKWVSSAANNLKRELKAVPHLDGC